MSTETITLATEYNPKTCEFPAYVSPKYDGIPVKIIRGEHRHFAVSRQNEIVGSIDHILLGLDADPVLKVGEFVVGEAVVPTYDRGFTVFFLSFEEGGGIVRRKQADEDTARIVLFMFDQGGIANTEPYNVRRERINEIARKYHAIGLYRAPEKLCRDHNEVTHAYAAFKNQMPGLEGVMIRPFDGVFAAGKRCKNMLRWKELDTHDLKIVGFEEAIEKKTGLGKGMVGRIVVEWKDGTTGVGPGSMKHTERKLVWENQAEYIGRVAEIAAKPSTYKKLREGRFKRWRPDKDVTT